jgi:plasmid stability protein
LSQLVVRNVEERLVRALKRRAAQHGHSAEAEHREILRQALEVEAEGESFKDFLLSMPNVGDDEVFARVHDDLFRDVEL